MLLPPAEEASLVESHLWVVEQVVRSRRFAWARKMLGEDTDMIGVGNEQLLRAARRYEPERGSFAPFARKLIANGVSDLVRAELRERKIWARAAKGNEDSLPVVSEGGRHTRDPDRLAADYFAGKRDDRPSMDAIRAQLTAHEWELISAHFGIGRPKELKMEIAARLGLDPAKVGACITSALAALRKLFRAE